MRSSQDKQQDHEDYEICFDLWFLDEVCFPIYILMNVTLQLRFSACSLSTLIAVRVPS